MKKTLKTTIYNIGILSLSATTLATVAVTSTVNIASANEVSRSVPKNTNKSQTSLSTNISVGYKFSNDNNYNRFVQKFNSSIYLTNDGEYKINYSSLPSNASKDEIKELKNIIKDQNKNIVQSKMYNDVLVQKSSKSVVTVPEVKEDDDNLSYRFRFHEGKTYVRNYWWGQRVHVSKSDLHKIGIILSQVGVYAGSGAAVATYIPALQGVAAPLGLFAAIAQALGNSLEYMPGGIAFNHSPFVGYWSANFQ